MRCNEGRKARSTAHNSLDESWFTHDPSGGSGVVEDVSQIALRSGEKPAVVIDERELVPLDRAQPAAVELQDLRPGEGGDDGRVGGDEHLRPSATPELGQLPHKSELSLEREPGLGLVQDEEPFSSKAIRRHQRLKRLAVAEPMEDRIPGV